MNMKKEYRWELRQLKKALRKNDRTVGSLYEVKNKTITAASRVCARGMRACERERLKIVLRVAVLEGRL
jgi:hypothetical protein